MTKHKGTAFAAVKASGSGQEVEGSRDSTARKRQESLTSEHRMPRLHVLPPAHATPLAKQRRPVAPRKRTKVLVVDGHPMVEEWIASLIGNEAEVLFVGHSGSLEETASLVEQEFPCLIVMELGRDANRGLEIVRALHQSFPKVRMLVFSSCDEVTYAVQAVRAGARGFVSKSAKGPELLRAIRVVLDDGLHLSSTMISRLAHGASEDLVAPKSGPAAVLSERELQVFNFVGNGLRPTEIGHRISLSVKTVETYLVRIREKLGLRDARALFQEAVKWSKSKA